MERHAISMRIKPGCFNEYRRGLGEIWSSLTTALDRIGIRNFSLWNIEELIFGYCETEDGVSPSEGDWELFRKLGAEMGDTFEWISTPGEPMRLMYQDFGIVRENKELIRHRVFATRLKPGTQEEYKRRHDALVEQRGNTVNPGPDSNFSIWNAGDYIFGYDEIDITMETAETEEDRQNTIAWETKMLEIMSWYTDDVDWITGLHHKHIQKIGHHN